MPIYIYMCIYKYIHTQTHIHTYIYRYMYIYIYVYIYMYICLLVNLFICFYMYQYIRTDFHSSVAAIGLAGCEAPRHLDFGTAGFLDSATNSRRLHVLSSKTIGKP